MAWLESVKKQCHCNIILRRKEVSVFLQRPVLLAIKVILVHTLLVMVVVPILHQISEAIVDQETSNSVTN